MNEPSREWNAPMSAFGSALVVLDDDRAARASTLVLQELGLTVDLTSSLDAAIEWIEAAHYEVVIAAGRDAVKSAEFAWQVRYLSRETRIVLLGEPGFQAVGLDDLGVEVVTAPVDVNGLMAVLGPTSS